MLSFHLFISLLIIRLSFTLPVSFSPSLSFLPLFLIYCFIPSSLICSSNSSPIFPTFFIRLLSMPIPFPPYLSLTHHHHILVYFSAAYASLRLSVRFHLLPPSRPPTLHLFFSHPSPITVTHYVHAHSSLPLVLCDTFNATGFYICSFIHYCGSILLRGE